MDCSAPGSSVHGILQARILEGFHALHQVNLPDPGIEPMSLASPALAGGFFTTRGTWEALVIILQMNKLGPRVIPSYFV